MSSASTKPTDPLSLTVRIMGKEYAVACPKEEHEALIRSADYLNERMTTIRRRGKALGAEKIAVMAALNLARELLESRGGAGSALVDESTVARLRQLHLDIDDTLALE